jgi:hypothetical protein
MFDNYASEVYKNSVDISEDLLYAVFIGTLIINGL